MRHKVAWGRACASAIIAAGVLSLSCGPSAERSVNWAETLENINYFCDVTSVRVDVIVGNGADGRGGGLQLFGGDFQRSSDFKEALGKKLSAALGTYGIAVDENASDELLVAIFGRPVRTERHQDEDSTPAGVIFLVEVFLDRDSQPLDLGNEGVAPPLGFQIGISEQHETEFALANTILDILERARCQEA